MTFQRTLPACLRRYNAVRLAREFLETRRMNGRIGHDPGQADSVEAEPVEQLAGQILQDQVTDPDRERLLDEFITRIEPGTGTAG